MRVRAIAAGRKDVGTDRGGIAIAVPRTSKMLDLPCGAQTAQAHGILLSDFGSKRHLQALDHTNVAPPLTGLELRS
jgi:hypothetical protein